MKKTMYRIFKPTIYKRFIVLKHKQQARMERLKKVVKELKNWDDIPISMQVIGLCKTLKIKPNDAAENFIYELCFENADLEEAARKLPLI
jgi:transcriptional regulator of NAD metabolism